MSNWQDSPNADVIRRDVPCAITGCSSKAQWDVSTRNRWGESSEWSPYCTSHAKQIVARAERRAETPIHAVGGESDHA